MTTQRSFKRLVRSRMEKTGESYTAARASAARRGRAEPAAKLGLTTSDETIRERTGRGWEEWFDLLDDVGRGGADAPRDRALARRAAGHPPAGLERAGGRRQLRAHAAACAPPASTRTASPITATKTVAVPVERLYDAFVDASLRERWLPGGDLRERTATKPRSARFDWGEDGTRVHVAFAAKGEAKSTAALSHARLADGEEAERMKAFWRERVAGLKEVLEA